MNLSVCCAVLAIFWTAAAAPLDEDVSKRFSFEPPPEGFDQNDPRLDPDPNIDNPPQRLLTFNSHDYSQPTNSGNSLLVTDLESKLPSPHLRLKRDTSKSLQLYNRVAVIARIANGIALQAGLMDGSIKIDDVLPELLNFGKMKVSDVVDFKPDSVTTFMNGIKSIQGTMNVDNKVLDMEDKIVTWNNLRKLYESIPNLNNFNPNTTFYADLATFTNSKIFSSTLLIETGFQRMKTYLNGMKNLNMQSISIDIEKNDALLLFQNIYRVFSEIMKQFKDIKQTGDDLQLEQSFEKSIGSLKQVETLIETIETRKEINYVKGTVNDLAPALKKNFESLLKAAASSKTSSSGFNVFLTVIKSRLNPYKTTRKFTSGFMNGVSDVQKLSNDTSISWIEKILNDKGDIQSLAKGWRPLTRNMDKVSAVDSALRNVLNEKLLKDIFEVAQMQERFTSLDPSLPSYSTIINEMISCGNHPQAAIDSSKNVLDSAMQLPGLLSPMRMTIKSVETLDLSSFKTSAESFIKTWGFKDIENNAGSIQELDNIIKNLQKNLIDPLITIIDDLDKNTVGLNAVNFKSLADVVQNGKTTISTFLNDANTKNEVKVFQCLQKIEKKSEAAANGIQLIQKLRSQDGSTVANVEKAISEFSKASKNLPALKSIPADMKKDVNSHITDLNNMTDALKTSQTIGESVNLLRGAVVLKELESDISNLKRILPIVQKEISNISSPLEKQTVESRWRNLQQEMSSVDGGIKTAVEFDVKLDVPKARIRRAIEFKTLEDYGIALPKLLDITDVTIDAEKKVKVLEILILRTNDPQVKAELEKAKSIFQKFVGLDLQFSKHEATLKRTPMAFKILQEFLIYFVSKKVEEDEQRALVNENNSGLPWYVWVGGSVAVILIGGGAVALVILVLRKKKDGSEPTPNESSDLLLKRFKNEIISTPNQYKNFTIHGFQVLLSADPKNPKGIKFPEGAVRHGNKVFCNPETAVYVKMDGKSIPLHANHLKTILGHKFIASQAPTECMLPAWLEMIFVENPGSIVMLCKWEENGSKKAFRYFSDVVGEKVTFGNYTVTTKSADAFKEGVTKRSLCFQDKRNPSRTVTKDHYQHEGWPDMGVPESPEAIYHILKATVGKKTVLVHCSAGIGRTGVFVGTQYAIDMGKVKPDFLLADCVRELRIGRWHSIQTDEQFAFVDIAYRYAISKDYGISMEYYEARLGLYNVAMGKAEKVDKKKTETKSTETKSSLEDPLKPSLHV